jgi:hypothetical protein
MSPTAASPAAEPLRFFSPPTPGAANGISYDGVVEPVFFAVGRGFHDAAFDETI